MNIQNVVGDSRYVATSGARACSKRRKYGDLRFWIDFKKQVDYLRAQSDAIMKIKKSFDDNGITIPFPIRTLDFGVVGGEKLAEALPPKLRGE